MTKAQEQVDRLKTLAQNAVTLCTKYTGISNEELSKRLGMQQSVIDKAASREPESTIRILILLDMLTTTRSGGSVLTQYIQFITKPYHPVGFETYMEDLKQALPMGKLFWLYNEDSENEK